MKLIWHLRHLYPQNFIITNLAFLMLPEALGRKSTKIKGDMMSGIQVFQEKGGI